jgi:hypothetical protein
MTLVIQKGHGYKISTGAVPNILVVGCFLAPFVFWQVSDIVDWLFWQGESLAVPERVPFRLTPNLVDAMGVCGYQGGFTVCILRTISACS